jgi:hypothetical protein
MGKSNTTSTADSYFVDKGSTSGPYNDRETITDVSTRRVTVDTLIKSAARKGVSIENAVYGHIRALRALGRTKVNTAEIAQALSLPLEEVHSIVGILKKKGVKVL